MAAVEANKMTMRLSILSVLDMETFRHEQEQEQADAHSLGQVRHLVHQALLDGTGGEEA